MTAASFCEEKITKSWDFVTFLKKFPREIENKYS